MATLRTCLEEAERNKSALGHFNISDTEGLWGVFTAARKVNVPIIVGTSEGEADFIGRRQAVALVSSLRDEFDHPIFINADHTRSLDRFKEAVDAGYDSVIFDGTELSFDENIRITKECVEYARSVRPEVLVEGEIGFIGASSKVLETLPPGVRIGEEHFTTPEELRRFVEESGVDLIAPAIGNVHGVLAIGGNPALSIRRITELRQASRVPLVLHGGSGISTDDIRKAIEAGMSIVHVNTDLRIAYRRGIQRSLEENPDEIAPYKFMKGGVQEIYKVAEEKLRLFSNV